MSLDDLIRVDATALAASGHDLPEAITYYSDGSKASAVTVQAIVIREEPDMQDERGRVADAEILIARSALTEAPTKCAKVQIVLQSGEAARDCRVTEVQARDNGFWVLEVRG